MDDAGSGGFCLSLVNGVGPAVAMAPYAARMLSRLLLWLARSSWTLNRNRAWQLRGRHDMGAVVVPEHPVADRLPQPADLPVSQNAQDLALESPAPTAAFKPPESELGLRRT